jgi:hypothetical protein
MSSTIRLMTWTIYGPSQDPRGVYVLRAFDVHPRKEPAPHPECYLFASLADARDECIRRGLAGPFLAADNDARDECIRRGLDADNVDVSILETWV